ncbi:MAG: tetratricopeptide repeat protein [Chloroflexota bacterium]|jgi:tetratricopeptide (TPR) repeat protein
MKNSENRRSKHGLSPRELRSSFLLPVVIALAIWLVGVVVYLLVPGEFNTAVSIIIGLTLFAYLLYYTRHARPNVRLLALLFAVPALVGIALSFSSGSARPLVIGVGLTFLLLVVQRLLDTPVSYRVALRYFSQGRMSEALQMINKAIEARPDFWESQQLRALIHLTNLDFVRAEKDARGAIALNPDAHPVYNTLGQVYLAQEQFERAAEIYEQALDLDPDNAIYTYHLGLSLHRQGLYEEAVEPLHTAVKRSLPLPEYELLAHYYLGVALEQTGRPQAAQEAYGQMADFEHGLDYLKEQYDKQPDYPHLPDMKADLTAVEIRLGQTPTLPEILG